MEGFIRKHFLRRRDAADNPFLAPITPGQIIRIQTEEKSFTPKEIMKITPLQDYLLVKVPDEREKVTETGMVIPETAAKEQPMRGTVLAVGPGSVLENGQFVEIDASVVGKDILFSRYSPEKYKEGNEEFYLVKYTNVLGLIE